LEVTFYFLVLPFGIIQKKKKYKMEGNIIEPKQYKHINVLFLDINSNLEPLIEEISEYYNIFNFEIRNAESFKNLNTLIKTGFFDMILLDLTLQENYKVEFLFKVHKIAKYIPLILLSEKEKGYIELKTSNFELHDTLDMNQDNQKKLTQLIYNAIEEKNSKNRIFLEKSEEKYRHIFEECPLPMMILNKKGIIIDCNYKLLDLIKINKRELIDRSYKDSFLKPIKKLNLFSDDNNNLTKREELPDSFELEISKFEYKKIWLELTFSLTELNEKPLFYIIFRDITKLRESEEEKIRLEKTLHEMNALIEHAPLAIFIIAQNGKIIRVNKEAKKLFQYEEEEFLTSKLFDYFPLDSIEQTMHYYNETIYDAQISNKIESRMIRKDGKHLDVEITSAILEISDNLFIQSFISDISTRKRYERNRDLLLDQLNESLEFKSVFLAEMSHDLRTPLNAIIGFSSLLLDESYGKLNEQQKEYLDDVYSAAEQLDGLIKSILDISKIEIGKLTLNKKEFNLFQLLTHLKSIFKSVYRKKGLHFRIENIGKDMQIYADPIRFKQILYNLIDNAIKFTDKGGLTIRVLERKNNWDFQVEDTGVGIKEKDYDVVFREFGRIESDIREEVPGSGIGLSLTKRLIKLHGGGIWFRSTPQQGTTFYFILPKQNNINGV